jgi:hypothetical protein
MLFARERLLFEEPLKHTPRTTCNIPDKFPQTIADWFRIQKQMMAYLSDLRGIANVPYSYLIRDKNVPDDSDFETEYNTSDAFFVACTAHHGTHYDIDNKWFAAELYKLADGSPISHHISPHLNKFDGRSAWLAMKTFAQGDANKSSAITRLKGTLAGLQYTGKGKYSFEKYTGEMLKCFTELDLLGATISEHDKVTMYLQKISDPSIQTHCHSILVDPLNRQDFHRTQTTLSDLVTYKQVFEKTLLPPRNIGATATDGDSDRSGRGDGRGGGRGRGGRGNVGGRHGNRNDRNTGRGRGDANKRIPASEYRKLSPAEREALRQNRRDRQTSAVTGTIQTPTDNHPAPTSTNEPPNKQRRTSSVHTTSTSSDSDSSFFGPNGPVAHLIKVKPAAVKTTATVTLGSTNTVKPDTKPPPVIVPTVAEIPRPLRDPTLTQALLLVTTSHPNYEKTQRSHPTFFPRPGDNPNLWKEADEALVKYMRRESRWGVNLQTTTQMWIYRLNIPDYSPSGRMTVEQKLLVLGGDPKRAREVDSLGCDLDENYYSMYGNNGVYPDGRYTNGAELPLYLRDRDAYEEELFAQNIPIDMKAREVRDRRLIEKQMNKREVRATATTFKPDDSVDQFGPGAHHVTPKPKGA